MSNFIKEFWDSQAMRFGSAHDASWGDLEMISLEVNAVVGSIGSGGVVVDAGCANGFSTRKIADRVKPSKLHAFDFSGEMIAQARESHLAGGVFDVNVFESDIRKIALGDGVADACYTTRTLINLPSWTDQQTGISECLRIIKPGGLVLLSEAFWEPLCKLNALRLVVGLPALVEHDFNRYIKIEKLTQWLTAQKLQFEIHDFSSMYYLGSRFIREMATDASAFPGFTNPINKDFADLARKYPSCGSIGVQQLVVIKK